MSLLLLSAALVWTYFKTQAWQVARTSWFELVIVDGYFSCYTAWAATTLQHQLAAAVTAVEGTVTVPLACTALGLLATVSLLASRRADPAFGFVRASLPPAVLPTLAAAAERRRRRHFTFIWFCSSLSSSL